jgi:organic radical activating enzyme
MTCVLQDPQEEAPQGCLTAAGFPLWHFGDAASIPEGRSAFEALQELLDRDTENTEDWFPKVVDEPATGEPILTHKLPDSEVVQRRPDGKVYLRVTDSCQERCLFCFFYDTDEIDNLIRNHDLSEVVQKLDPQETTQVVLTGGEPTLNPDLISYVKVLYDRGFKDIILQSNAIRLAEGTLLEELEPYKEVLGIGFSVHAASAETNDIVTTVARDLFAPKLVALRKASEMGFRIKCVYVMNKHNLPELKDFINLVHDHCPGSKPLVQFTFPSVHGRQALFMDSYPRLVDAGHALPPALKRAREVGVPVSFCHTCQVPPCIIPDQTEHLECMWFDKPPQDWWDMDHGYGPECESCVLKPRCPGVWQGYLDHFGTEELKPLTEADTQLEGFPEQS